MMAYIVALHELESLACLVVAWLTKFSNLVLLHSIIIIGVSLDL